MSISTPSTVKAVIALGANLGSATANLQQAAQLINRLEHTRILCASSLYSTKPVGYLDQDDFINAVLEVETLLSPSELYTHLAEIEQQFGRQRLIKNGPRTLDLDVITYGNTVSTDSFVTLPHPRAQERAFVLVPLCEIDPDLVFADSKLSARAALEQLPPGDLAGVVKLTTQLFP